MVKIVRSYTLLCMLVGTEVDILVYEDETLECAYAKEWEGRGARYECHHYCSSNSGSYLYRYLG